MVEVIKFGEGINLKYRAKNEYLKPPMKPKRKLINIPVRRIDLLLSLKIIINSSKLIFLYRIDINIPEIIIVINLKYLFFN